jgi:hypothetical protein
MSALDRSMAKNSRANPFYVLLVIFGIAFSLTACAYGVMAFRAVRGAVFESDRRAAYGVNAMSDATASESPAGKALLRFLDEHGAFLLGVELGLLALATIGAIGTDGYWGRQIQNPKSGIEN